MTPAATDRCACVYAAVEEMHALFLQDAGLSSEEAPLVTIDPDNWEQPFS